VSVLAVAAALCFGAAPVAWAGTSTLQNPSVVFTTPGTKQVSLTACNGALCSNSNQNVLVLDPRPAITGALLSVTAAEVGQLVHLSGTGTGKSPLSFLWQVTPVAAPSFTLSGASSWWNTTGLTPGIYTTSLSLSNGSGTAVSLPSVVTLSAPTPTDFYTINPCRAYDSRSGAALVSGSTTAINVLASACGIPSNARVVVGNLTVVSPTGQGYVTVYPGNDPQPLASTENFNSGVVLANSVILPLATDGSGTLNISLLVGNNGTANVVLDVAGYFAP
jgi:PKD repeat protein